MVFCTGILIFSKLAVSLYMIYILLALRQAFLICLNKVFPIFNKICKVFLYKHFICDMHYQSNFETFFSDDNKLS